MADVTKTIENIDRLFSQIIVNGEVHESQNYVPPTPQQATPSSTQDNTPSQTTPSTPSTQTQGEPVYAVELNKVVHDFIDRVVTQGLANEIEARQAADNILQGYINALNALVPASASSTNKLATSAQLQTVAADVAVVQADISDIEALIPNQASQSNQLADKDFVNSSIATNTANFLGTYTSLSDIEAIQNPTNNDYAYLQTTDSAGNTQFQRYKYSASDNQWHYEYTLNNSSFTAEQWATINSGLTVSSVAQSISDAISADKVDSVASGNMKSVTSNAVAGAISEAVGGYRKIFFEPTTVSGGSYYKITGLVGDMWLKNSTFLLESRGGETIFLSFASDDSGVTYPIGNKLTEKYGKINGLRFSTVTGYLFIELNAFANFISLTQLSGNYNGNIQISPSNATEYADNTYVVPIRNVVDSAIVGNYNPISSNAVALLATAGWIHKTAFKADYLTETLIMPLRPTTFIYGLIVYEKITGFGAGNQGIALLDAMVSIHSGSAPDYNLLTANANWGLTIRQYNGEDWLCLTGTSQGGTVHFYGITNSTEDMICI